MGFYYLILLLMSSISTLHAARWLEKWQSLRTNCTEVYRENNLLLYGVEQKEKESACELAKEIGYYFGISRPLEDVLRAHRLECTKRPKPLILRMKSFAMKMKWIKMYQMNHIWSKGWYLFEHLPKEIWMVFQETKKWARSKNYTTVWVKHNEVFYRKNTTSPVLKVVDLDHLDELKWDEYHYEVHGHWTDFIGEQKYSHLKHSRLRS